MTTIQYDEIKLKYSNTTYTRWQPFLDMTTSKNRLHACEHVCDRVIYAVQKELYT